ncbi:MULTISPECIES: magnesium transporter [Nitrosomonas]|uniref:Magnesium transporter MgtE n=1 Tax=Nitrosomonas europaea (strain ATCC 19718 / CIP 103999 / KCTC 2705 / NBRC 14298) TaxID=228410 RepID=Q820K9_NITEU|nr:MULTISPECIES: magnesium transporter [Nitrosomonas]QOJ08398.1 MAG: magnesium transporter [Nitrosomonas sp. H1_AOB3]CAD85544.1 CBS domain:Divalent cation transporter [Nitrosomonas europaea ATCC 19718]SDW49731.1 magnesium transporter [Nitrosomonas europaea]SET11841.1 magnesium transporter [Nitrosomonas europaea]SJZ62799.1 magnesium transporter [Nitrosomonas europaea]
MTEENHENLEDKLQKVTYLLQKYKLVEGFVRLQDTPEPELIESIIQKQNLSNLRQALDKLHPADIAHILEALPLEDRLIIWGLVKAEQDGEVLLEVSDAVRQTLIEDMDSEELVAAAEQLDADEIADLAPDLPSDVMEDVFQALPMEEREQLRAAMSYSEDAVGALMDFDVITVRGDVRIEVVLRYLRRLGELPDHTDQLFVVDRTEQLQGVLLLNQLLVSDPEATVMEVMARDTVKFLPDDKAEQATHAFERYDLVTAPVISSEGKLLGRVTVNAVIDFMREKADLEARSQAGLSEEEDLFAPIWKSVRNRWAWLAINLVTAFIASRVIGLFENSIEKLVALAALMPIVAGVGGNSGNQTITMIVRAIALGQVNQDSTLKLISKEIGVGIVNGIVWGSVVGLFTYAIYRNMQLGLVMALAMLLNLLLAAFVGVLIPLTRKKFGRDPALGSSVLITAVTDSGGFFIFLGLATLFLL